MLCLLAIRIAGLFTIPSCKPALGSQRGGINIAGPVYNTLLQARSEERREGEAGSYPWMPYH